MEASGPRNRKQPPSAAPPAEESEDCEALYYERLERRGRNMAIIVVTYMVLCVAVFLWFQVGRVPPPMLVVLAPGFRWDYLDHLPAVETPFFTSLVERGSRAKWLQPSFPASHRFSRQAALLSGQDETLTAASPGKQCHTPWKCSLPLWHSAIKQWRKAALYGVPGGCEQEDGYRVQVCKPSQFAADKHNDIVQKGAQEFGQFFGEAMALLSAGSANFAVVQTEVISAHAELHGASPDHVREAIKALDKQLLQVQKSIGEDKFNLVNLIIVSDGGLTDIRNKRSVDITDHLTLTPDLLVVGGAGAGMLYTNKSQIDKIANIVSKIDGVETFTAANMPAGYVSESQITPDLLLLAKNGAAIRTPGDKSSTGFNFDMTEGSDAEAMRGVLLAAGPSIQRSFLHAPVVARDVYPLLAAMLDITPELHDGSLYRTADMVVW